MMDTPPIQSDCAFYYLNIDFVKEKNSRIHCCILDFFYEESIYLWQTNHKTRLDAR